MYIEVLSEITYQFVEVKFLLLASEAAQSAFMKRLLLAYFSRIHN